MYIPLHSTMFLLIQGSCKSSKDFFISFTFHNVSINTSGAWQLAELGLNFTFHNVSINTGVPLVDGVKDGELYIPQCFY